MNWYKTAKKEEILVTPNTPGESNTIENNSNIPGEIVPQNIEKTPETSNISDVFSLNQFEDMMQRAFNINREWLQEEEPPVFTWQEWVKSYDAQSIADSIDSYYQLYDLFLKDLPEEIRAVDLIEAYKSGKLGYKSTTPYRHERPQLVDNPKIKPKKDSLPWVYEKAKELDSAQIIDIYQKATERKKVSNEEESVQARKDLFLLYNSDRDLAKKLGIKDSELNQKMRNLTGFSITAKKLEEAVNNGVADDYKWAGITNTSYIGRQKLKHKDLDRLVKKIDISKEGQEYYFSNAGELLRRNIAVSFLAIDSRISYKELSFEIGECKKQVGETEKSYGGLFMSQENKIRISHIYQNTVSHEIGHYLDYKFSTDFGGANSGLSETKYGFPELNEKQRAWINKYKEFIKSLMGKSDITSEYMQEPKEVFARFVAKFVEWTSNQSGGRNFNDDRFKDKFTELDFKTFIYLLQEKAWLDRNFPVPRKKKASSNNIKCAGEIKCGWILPDGSVEYVPFYGHIDFIKNNLRRFNMRKKSSAFRQG